MSQYQFLETPVEFLKGVGPQKAAILKSELGIQTFGDLLTTFPFRYVDRSRILPISGISDDSTYIQLRARLVNVQVAGSPRQQRLVATVRDESGEIELVWFQGVKWILDLLSPRQEYLIFGKPSLFNGKWNIPHPELEAVTGEILPPVDLLRPIYPSTEKLKSKGLDYKGIGRLVKTLLSHEKFMVKENLTHPVLQSLRLMDRAEAFRQVHFPSSADNLRKAQNRLKFEELFYVQLRLVRQRAWRLQKIRGYVFAKVGDYLNQFYHHHLTFELTGAQKRVIREIRQDMGSGRQMNRLLQGDVGSGKTMVALMTMLIALDNGFQSCLMAPTEILARQHFQTLSRMLTGMAVKVGLLTGSSRQAERRLVNVQLEQGELQILIGTHALLEENVKFKNLGMVVIDEQHRFGVAQRARLWDKSETPPHVLVMTATPIPRTLAMTLYGDLETSVIDELPPGRKPIVTRHTYITKHDSVFSFLRTKIAEGRQVYIVYPLIQESETLDLQDLEAGYRQVLEAFPPPSHSVVMVHGRMKQQEKDAAMEQFICRKAQIMVATTVIEVGVDVPNASVMVIENAERFGLSQLHQLRGRVGRGADQSYCILISRFELSAEAKTRLSTMVRTTNGFEIAETDLRLRGPGDLQGTRQSGILDLKIADIVKDEKMLKYARDLAASIIASDPFLDSDENAILAHHLAAIDRKQQNWGLIS